MAGHLSVPILDARPGLMRSRSSSSPSATRDDDKSQLIRPARPTHTRSRSYMSPIDPKPILAATFPAATLDKPVESSRFHRLHLPGRHHHQHQTVEDSKTAPRLHGRHKYTQSEAIQYHKKRDSALLKNDSPGTPIVITPASSSSDQPTHDQLYPSSRGAAIPSLARMASTRSYRGNLIETGLGATGLRGADSNAAGLRRRANSDPRFPTYDAQGNQLHPAKAKSSIELDLERADLLRQHAYDNATSDDLKRKAKQLRSATNEIHERLTTTTRTASDLMRRLDDTQDTLFRTTESLIDTISSFTNLTDQTSTLVSNFSHETRHLDRETRNRISRYYDSICTGRRTRVEELESRGKLMSQKAAELGQRLENCRTIVRNWEEREMNKRKAWRGVWVGVIWGVALIVVAVLAGVASFKAAEVRSGGGTAAERLRHIIVHNHSHDSTVLDKLEVPEEVRRILVDIDNRARGGGKDRLNEPGIAKSNVDVNGNTERGFRLLDEL